MKPKKLAELYQTPLLSGGVWARDYQSSQPSRILCESHAFDSQLTLLRIQPRFSRNSARVVLYPGIVVMEMRQYARCTCMAWLATSARIHTYVLACAYALHAVRQHCARPYRIALLVLTLPHSNAEEEQVFSLVTKNKFRPNLKLDGTLSSILTIKLANTAPCQDYEPPKEVLESARKATMAYNRAHSSRT